MSILAPGFFDPIFANPPGIAGFPAGIALNGIALALMTLGVAVMQRTTSRPKAMLALGLFTIPAVLLVIFGPAVILIIQNIAT